MAWPAIKNKHGMIQPKVSPGKYPKEAWHPAKFWQNFTNFCLSLVFPGCFEIQFVCDKVVIKNYLCSICCYFPATVVLFTVFEVYSYLLMRLFVNHELLYFGLEMHRYRYRHIEYRYIGPKITISVSVLL